ncbi:unnamed protein product, partial [Ectocarpus fasciculatus]
CAAFHNRSADTIGDRDLRPPQSITVVWLCVCSREHTLPRSSSLAAPMERNAFASLFSQPQGVSKKKQGFNSTPRSKHVQSSAKRPRSSPSPSAASPSG